jgi:signal transduction histidine kinase
VETSCPEHAEAEVDRELMLRVLVNLLSNAREALGGRGVVRLEVALEEAPAGGAVSFRVSDTGRGMSSDFMRESLFRPFASTKPHGLGIGLVQSKSIVEAHGGRIEAESQPGRGATFVVRLPVQGPAAAPAERASYVG